MFEIPDTISTLKKELFSFLHKGILFDEGKKFFWINIDGKKCLSISSVSFLDVKQHKYLDLEHSQLDSRFSVVVEYSFWKFHDVKCQIKTSLLSLGAMYEARLVFKYREQPNVDLKSLKLITIKWKTQELSVRSTHTVELISDDWCKVKMWHFINHGLNANFDITIEELVYAENPSISSYGLLIQGVEFQPMEHKDIEVIKGLKISDVEDIEVDDEEYWAKKLPDDYESFIKMADKPLNYTMKKELYFLLCEGFHSDNGDLWFSLCKSFRGICCMLSATKLLSDWYERLEARYLSESRFDEAIKLINANWVFFRCKLRSTMFSPHHTYACYLVCKVVDNILADDYLDFGGEYYMDGVYAGSISSLISDRIFYPMNIPTLNPIFGLQNSSNIPLTGVHGSMEPRDDGWKKVILCKPRGLQYCTSLEIKVTRCSVSEIVVSGIEFRPCII